MQQMMQPMMQIVHSNQFYPIHNGQASLHYVGYKYPESQWAGLLKESHSYETLIREIGHITLRAEADGPVYELERKLLIMAKRHGAHIVLIDYTKSFELENNDSKRFNNHVTIYARCQRFEL